MKIISDIVLVAGGGLTIALAIVCLYYAVTNWLETRETLRKFREYEKTQDEPVAKARRGGL